MEGSGSGSDDGTEPYCDFFVLDTSSWSSIRDQDLRIGGVTEFDTRLVGQVMAMKLLCCWGMPSQVGVAHMGNSSASRGLELTPKWRTGEAAGTSAREVGDLGCYEANSDPIFFDDFGELVPQDQNPQRVVQALNLGLASLKTASNRGKRITVFLCSPITGLRDLEAQLIPLRQELDGNGIEVEFILHPKVYSKAYDNVIGGPEGSQRSSRDEGVREGMAAVSISDIRSEDEDLDTLANIFSIDVMNNIPYKSFLETLAMYKDVYFDGITGLRALSSRWSACWPESDAQETMPRILFVFQWSPTSSERGDD
ncbi:hypothetical protein HOP50_11g63380 [Chloropicon primus]|uniref:Uncharacterized protein n=1 Tax=Chloropicon primus TaxID=1764295 RepID=A0A5B8MSP9_9CHLO|nr:hypothetical protein A3770_11p63160 [Chloropicon primus]UPR03011.1 hypothetical protein HOP50_11g63380 [Chloropicon primus]|eukprot:QDZ23798.1 hypothetical protein A3770_11p63160 [Chloropicon primus]